MIYKSTKDIEDFIIEMHNDQVDKSGKRYYFHPLRVAASVKLYGEEAIQTALLHDILEDTKMTPRQLHELYINPDVIYNIMLLTKSPQDIGDLGYFRYLQRLMSAFNNRIAILVKSADLDDNISRLVDPELDH